jgi:AraC-like DNA-binding protein
MLTLQHSEALAVWAFRARVWDYLVKPSAPAEIDRVCAALRELTELRHGSHVRRPLKGATPLPTEVRFFGESERQDVRPAIEYIHTHFAEKISEATVAALCGMNRFQFSRAFSKTQGITFNDYLIGYRIREACRLFQNPRISVTDVALMVGFSDVSHFGRMFKRHCGVLPSTYRAGVAHRPESEPDELQADEPRQAVPFASEIHGYDSLDPLRLSLKAPQRPGL